MQFGLVGFCALILPIIDFGVSKSPYQEGKLGLATLVLRKCQSTVNEVNAFYALSIFIAAIVRFKQTPPVFEIVFIYNLLNVQNTIILAVLAFRFYDSRFNGVPFRKSHSLYDIGNGIIGLVTSYSFSLRNDSFPVLFDACKSCNRFYQYSDFSSFFQIDHDAGSSAKVWAISIAVVIALCIAGVLLAVFVARIRRIFPKWLRKYFFYIFALLLEDLT